jgi:hypothetical protein
MTITSPAFEDGEAIPTAHTCDGKNTSPPLEWSGVPDGTKSLALICDDPDAPIGTWVHWVYFNIPASLTGLPEGLAAGAEPETGGIQGRNGWRKRAYGGPCPPGGTHRYYFRLYALDAKLELAHRANKRRLRRAMDGHIVAEATLMGTYSRT